MKILAIGNIIWIKLAWISYLRENISCKEFYDIMRMSQNP